MFIGVLRVGWRWKAALRKETGSTGEARQRNAQLKENSRKNFVPCSPEGAECGTIAHRSIGSLVGSDLHHRRKDRKGPAARWSISTDRRLAGTERSLRTSVRNYRLIPANIKETGNRPQEQFTKGALHKSRRARDMLEILLLILCFIQVLHLAGGWSIFGRRRRRRDP